MQVTFETKIKDVSVYPQLAAYAELFGRVEHALFRDLHVRGLKLADLKRDYQPNFGINARQFNSAAMMLDGKVKAVEETLKLRITNLKDKVSSCQKAVKEYEKKLLTLKKEQKQGKEFVNPRRKAKAPQSQPVPTHEAIHRLKFVLHNKKRRLSLLEAKLTKAQNEAGRPVLPLTFGSKKLFRAQFSLVANGFSSHDEWKIAWQRARSSQFVCVGTGSEPYGNQNCTYYPATQTLRLRLPHALITAGDAKEYAQNKYLYIRGIVFAYGNEAVEATQLAELPLTFRFIRRDSYSRSGKTVTGEAWYVQVTCERASVAKTTKRELGALGIDLNSKLVATSVIDRFGNPTRTKHYPVQLQGRRTNQVTATLGDTVAAIITVAKKEQIPVVIEKLDFSKKKAALREKSPRYTRMLSAFAYKKFYELIYSRAGREGVEVIEVNPAFTSVIGLIKYKTGYGLSTHVAASIAIARRGMKFSEKLLTRGQLVLDAAISGEQSTTALLLPVRNRARHVWSDWGILAKGLRKLRGELFSLRGRSSSEETSGGITQKVVLSSKTGKYWLCL